MQDYEDVNFKTEYKLLGDNKYEEKITCKEDGHIIVNYIIK